jgi:outer membrane receptor protein involved in Fe transport
MKITISLIALLIACSFMGYAQSNYTIKGSATDTTEKRSLLNTTVMVLNAKDSILYKFTRVTADGSFVINNLKPGKFIMVMSYPGYADYSEDFVLDDKTPTHNFGKIGLVLKARLLKDVIIKGQVTAIKIKGDTTEFNAKAYVIQPNDKVEDLIRQFPGIQVDKDGKITAQGQTVSKVLLDGEEFFGDDPTLVTKNIRADMVDKVQLYDKKSDQATFTGIDDGVKTKTLNIKLKDGKKAGYFGKADVGIGTDKYYTGQLLYNKFQNKEKFSLYGTAANTGKTGLNWDDNQKYADGGGGTMDDNGNFYFNGSGDDLRYNGRGIPIAKTGGSHYDNKWANDKYTINGNYKLGALDIDATQNTVRQNYLPDRIIKSTTDQSSHNTTFRQKLDATFNIKFDTTSNLKVAVDGTVKHITSNTTSIDTSRRINNTLLNQSNNITTNDNHQHRFNASAFYTKKLKKKGRTISALFAGSSNDDASTGFLNSRLLYFDTTGVANRTQLTDQYKTVHNKNLTLNTNFTYTEPILKSLSIVFNYGLNANNGSSDQRSYSKPAGGNDYTVLVDSLSNFFKLNQLSNQVGAIFNYTKGKAVINFGTRASDVSFKQINEYTGDILKRHFINWNPQAMLIYKFSQQQSLRLSYNGNTNQPSINQIQPVKNNNNTLYETLGNPDLTPSFRNGFNGYFNSYKVLSGQSIYISANYSFTTNPIVTNTSTDAGGKTTVKYFNLPGKSPHNYSLYTDLSRKIWGINMGIGGNVYGNTSYNMVRNDVTNITQLNTTNAINYQATININKYVQNKFNFYASAGPTYSINQTSLQPSNNSNGGGFSGYFGGNYYLPYQFEINSDANYTYTAKTTALPQGFRSTIVNVSLTKSFFKEKNLKLTAAVNDLLNQNNGFNRYAYGSIITEDRYNTIKRYFMFSVTYDFTKMSAGSTK